MSRQVTSCYPVHVGYSGGIEYLEENWDINSLSGIYLDYALAAAYKPYKVVSLCFDVGLKPYRIEVEDTSSGKNVNWTLEDMDDQEFSVLCNMADIQSSDTSRITAARGILSKICDQPYVRIPNYRFKR